ncbi:MAG: NADH-quinone oxidoreductase subunit C [Aquihabitans sp.]
MEETPEAPEVDEARQAVVDKLTEELGEAVVGSHIQPGDDVWVRVTREAWRTAGLIARDNLGFRYFEYLSAIDWLPSPYGLSEDSPTDARPEPNTEIVTGHAGGDTRFQVIARVHSLTQKLGIHFKVDLPDDDLSLPTWLPVFAGVNWHEREVHEMFGITFAGHPYLQNLYLPGEFEGHPLRKDFPLLARFVKPWPGIVDVEPMPASDDEAEAETEEAAE